MNHACATKTAVCRGYAVGRWVSSIRVRFTDRLFTEKLMVSSSLPRIPDGAGSAPWGSQPIEEGKSTHSVEVALFFSLLRWTRGG